MIIKFSFPQQNSMYNIFKNSHQKNYTKISFVNIRINCKQCIYNHCIHGQVTFKQKGTRQHGNIVTPKHKQRDPRVFFHSPVRRSWSYPSPSLRTLTSLAHEKTAPQVRQTSNKKQHNISPFVSKVGGGRVSEIVCLLIRLFFIILGGTWAGVA